MANPASIWSFSMRPCSASGKFEKIPLEVHQKLLRLNAETPMVMAARLAAMGKLNANARLVFVSSLSHFTGYPGAASYAASKDAIAVYAKSIRKPFARFSVRVCCVFPGPMQTAQAETHAPMGAERQQAHAARGGCQGHIGRDCEGQGAHHSRHRAKSLCLGR